jgi:hypothetical protein
MVLVYTESFALDSEAKRIVDQNYTKYEFTDWFKSEDFKTPEKAEKHCKSLKPTGKWKVLRQGILGSPSVPQTGGWLENRILVKGQKTRELKYIIPIDDFEVEAKKSCPTEQCAVACMREKQRSKKKYKKLYKKITEAAKDKYKASSAFYSRYHNCNNFNSDFVFKLNKTEPGSYGYELMDVEIYSKNNKNKALVKLKSVLCEAGAATLFIFEPHILHSRASVDKKGIVSFEYALFDTRTSKNEKLGSYSNATVSPKNRFIVFLSKDMSWSLYDVKNQSFVSKSKTPKLDLHGGEYLEMDHWKKGSDPILQYSIFMTGETDPFRVEKLDLSKL